MAAEAAEAPTKASTRFCLTGMIGIFLGLVLVILTTPYVFRSFSMLPGDRIVDALGQGKDTSESDLKVLIESYESASQWKPTADLFTNIGRAKQKLALMAGANTEDGQSLLKDAEFSYEKGLALAPADAYNWARLAYVRFGLRGHSDDVAKALNISANVSLYDLNLIRYRLRLHLRTWLYQDAEGKELILEQTRMAWNYFRSANFLRMIGRNAVRIYIVQQALADRPTAIKQFNQRMAAQRH